MHSVAVVKDESSVIFELAQIIQTVATESIAMNDKFSIGLSGGSLVKYLSTGLPKVHTDFTKWTFFFCDERVVPENDPDSTFGVYKRNLIGTIPVSEAQFVRIKQGVTAEEAAEHYSNAIKKHFNLKEKELPVFDLLLLGMGPDGHTCSLFPGHKLLEEKELLVAPINDSPKPPPSRVTLTFPVINNARNCVFAAAGAGKADMVQRILQDKEDLPAGRVKLTNGLLMWIVDNEAAQKL